MNNLSLGAVMLVVGSLAASQVWAVDAKGRLLSADGGVLIQRGVQTNVGQAGSLLGVGDTVLTTDTGSAQWQMSDDSIFAMAPDSGLKINRYELPSQSNRSGVASYTLLQGAVRTITGKIGSVVAAADTAPQPMFASSNGGFNPAYLIKVAASPASAYALKSAFAVVSTQSADFAASQSVKQFAMIVNQGTASACSGGGCTTVGAGQALVVSCPTCKPVQVSPSSLALNSIMASLSLTSTNPSASVTVTTDPRTPVPSGPGCVTVAAQLQAGTGVPSAPGVPVSPN
jgi:hypothetical protein